MRNPLNVLLRGSSFLFLRRSVDIVPARTLAFAFAAACPYVCCVCVTCIVTGTRDLSTIQVTYFIISLAHDYTGAHTSARLQVYRGSCTRVLQTHTYRQDIHTAVYVCVYTYNLTIHITMYTFFVFLRVRGWEGVFLLGRITGSGAGVSKVGRFCLLFCVCVSVFHRGSRVFFGFGSRVFLMCVFYVREIERIDE